ncbi:hypothetical protein EA187_17370 [Lujinxingia sediminis]|uniref:3-keto-5-aminohexanoate cleavage protein n=1 Tax=Lujinxingia sediminis TaxID=2480984 RepID=A0ABY0CNU5_9DELT|nr:hypothetical protein [Lujinxingia sediminis]RVU42109.1 hypothetical protein EA187_17370 [Lujinxingia sediminis]
MDSRRIISVGPVVSLQEAQALLNQGAKELFVLTHPHSRYGAEDTISSDELEAIRRSCSAPIGVIIAPGECLKCSVGLALEFDASFVYVDCRLFSEVEVKWIQDMVSCPVRLYGFWIHHDEDPEWLKQDLSDYDALKPFSPIVTLIQGLYEPFEYLFCSAGEFDDDVLLSDIVELCDREKERLSINSVWTASKFLPEFLALIPSNIPLVVFMSVNFATQSEPVCVERGRALSVVKALASI